LRAVDLLGTPPRKLTDAGSLDEARGASWSTNGTIVYSQHYTGGLKTVASTGGEPEVATELDPNADVGTHRFPLFLPDGRHFVYYASPGTGGEPGELHLAELGSTVSRRLVESHSAAVYSPTGHLVYARGDVLVAHPFDAERLELTGDPLPLGPKLPGGLAVSGLRSLSVADNGTLVYRVEDLSTSRLVWRSRDGTQIGTVGDDESWYYGPSISPDGRSVLVGRYPITGDGDIWLYDRERGLGRPLVTGPNEDDVTVWSPDGRAIAFLSSGSGTSSSIEILRLDDPDAPRTMIHGGDLFTWPTQWLPDGSGVLVARSASSNDIAMIDPARPGELIDVLSTPFGETDGQVSPDGRWLAYASDVSGRKEIYVRPFRGAGSDWQVSTDGGSRAKWSRDGGELFFLGVDGWLHAARVTDSEVFATEPPERLFHAEIDQSQSTDPGYDVASDGSFLINQRAGDTGEPIVVVIGMEQLLARLGTE
jgi:Tol biopolymer transport system component